MYLSHFLRLLSLSLSLCIHPVSFFICFHVQNERRKENDDDKDDIIIITTTARMKTLAELSRKCLSVVVVVMIIEVQKVTNILLCHP